MSYHAPVGGFREDAIKAMTDNPSYFATWYTAKSIGLCAAVAYVAYLLGQRSEHRRRTS